MEAESTVKTAKAAEETLLTKLKNVDRELPLRVMPASFTVDQVAALRAAIDTLTTTRAALTTSTQALRKAESVENATRAEYSTAVLRYRALAAALAGLGEQELRA